MKICGFTFVRNAVKYDYPIVESIRSILPICDQFIVLAGDSSDGTNALVHQIGDPKITIVPSVWDDSLRSMGNVLSSETNKALDLINDDFDWVFYLQADEVVHEQYHGTIKEAMLRWKDDKAVEGLLFKYLHFFGTYDYIGDSRSWYRKEIRIIKNDKAIRSYKDAQGFRKKGKKLHVKEIDAWVYHYGWVKSPLKMQEKLDEFVRYWRPDEEIINYGDNVPFDFSSVESIAHYNGGHPLVMRERIKQRNWHVEIDVEKKRFNFIGWLLYKFEKVTGYRLFEYRNYKRLR